MGKQNIQAKKVYYSGDYRNTYKTKECEILPQFAIVDKSSYHAARINVSCNAFLTRALKKKNIFFDVHTG